MHKIKPRIDDDGPKCFFIDEEQTEKCPQIYGHMCCKLDNLSHWTKLCPHAVKRMAVELEAWREGYFKWNVCGVLLVDGDKYDTIEAAVDALMEELEE